MIMKRLAHIVCQTKSKQTIWSGMILQTVPIRLPTSRIILSPDINYQLSAQQLQDASNKVADVIILKFTDERDGIWNNDKNKERLKRMVVKNKNQPL